MGKWITFEGIGGCGKGTQIELIYNWLIEQDIQIVKTKEPGGTEFGSSIRKLVLPDQHPKLSPFTELMLFQADRHETVKQIIIPALNQGAIVLSDRGPFGTIAYQGFGKGVDLDLIDKITVEATEGRKPDFTFLLDIDPEIAKKRIKERNNSEIDQFDLEEIQFQEKVRKGFIDAAKNDKAKKVFTIDGSKQIQEIHYEIINIFEDHII
ncbi:dTMP kinase [Lysinibacillus fusiformis]|uniref:dTMP kinase n=1 Tax=Lysinibacillus fusiformis TaxID=28031 RepID=UPI002D783323|nr:dTMP kinase [Lysinibacillus fusiformis]WRS98582.1 dTMP kinase [Lysinibacillus fusiformis]